MVFKRTARDIMTTTVITVKDDMVLTNVIKLLLRWHISGVPVVDDEKMLLVSEELIGGLISEVMEIINLFKKKDG